MKLKIIMCEGAHDIAFLSKIILANGYKAYEKKVKEYPKPLNKLIEGKLSTELVGDKKLGFSVSYTIPYASYYNESSLVLFHNMGGDATLNERIALIDTYKEIDEAIKDYIESASEIEEIEFYLFYDADDLGINGRISKIIADFGNQYHIPSSEIKQGVKSIGGDIILGVYIFHNSQDVGQKGTLEDQVLALMEINEKYIIDQARNYIKDNVLSTERTQEYEVGKDKYKTKAKFEEKKSVISVAGQLQFSGCNNSIIISKSDYIKKEVILADAECINIFHLINN